MSELKTPQELGTEKIGKLLIRYAVPAMIAMLASSLYNIVDRAFIGHGVGPMALSGLAVTFPLMNLSAALGSMVGVGSGTMISLKLGQKDHKSAQMLLGNSVTMNVLIGVLFGVFSLIFINPILRLFGATDVTIGYAREYMTIILAGNAFTHLYLGINCILRAAGHPNKAMVATIGTVLLNTLLDYLFIMVFHWGIKGAAIATVISQVLAFTWQCFQLSDKSELIHLQRGTYRLRGDLVRNIITIGLSPCLMNAAACFVVLLINRGLLKYGSDVAIGAYSIVNSFGFLIVMMVMGFNQAMQPIVMAYSNKFGRLVLTTGNKSECAVGYSTLYGDTAGAFAPICDVLKTDVWALCRWRNAQAAAPVIPETIIDRAPSAELREGQTDQQSLPPYEVLDAIIRGYVEKRQTAGEIAKSGIDEKLVHKVIGMIHRAEYKRRQCPPGPRVSSVSFASGWCYPLGIKI